MVGVEMRVRRLFLSYRQGLIFEEDVLWLVLRCGFEGSFSRIDRQGLVVEKGTVERLDG